MLDFPSPQTVKNSFKVTELTSPFSELGSRQKNVRWAQEDFRSVGNTEKKEN